MSRSVRVLGAGLGLLAVSGVAAASGGTLMDASRQTLAVPTWLFLTTGGGVVAASFLLASFVTDRRFVAAVDEWRRRLPASLGALALAGQLVGVAGFALVVFTGFRGPTDELRSAAVLLVWVGWWAAFAIFTYVVGNAWPAVDPFRTLTRPLARLHGVADRSPNRNRGAWAATAFLLGLVWFEVVSPVTQSPRVLAAGAVAYLAFAAAGVAAVGHREWFERVDPLARLFRMYGSVAPVQRTDDGLEVRLPAMRLTDVVVSTNGGVAFVVAVVWGTTFDGLVGTPAWASFARVFVEAGVPAHILYPVALLGGFAVFHRLYWWAVRAAKRGAPTYVGADELARRFAPTLLAIAAGYHFAHFFTYALSMSPTLFGVLFAPMDPPVARVLVLPPWSAGIGIAAVLLGHLLAIWVAHATAYDVFPGRLQAIRSQYALTAAMVVYTMTSLWIIGQPAAETPFL